jgi:hypothetical protein
MLVYFKKLENRLAPGLQELDKNYRYKFRMVMKRMNRPVIKKA